MNTEKTHPPNGYAIPIYEKYTTLISDNNKKKTLSWVAL
uniref:Uncharacterized protein n=1 Tax=Rheinheimera sp. BAL341 TaxID=1708203 RepID=A0A486XPV1_9GAMM